MVPIESMTAGSSKVALQGCSRCAFQHLPMHRTHSKSDVRRSVHLPQGADPSIAVPLRFPDDPCNPADQPAQCAGHHADLEAAGSLASRPLRGSWSLVSDESKPVSPHLPPKCLATDGRPAA